MSVRSVAIEKLEGRLEQIRKSNGYATDAGQLIFLGEQPVLGPDDPVAAIAMVVRRDEPGYQGENVDTVLPVEVQAIVKADITRPWATIEAVIGDIKKAVEVDHDLGGTLKPRGLERGATEPMDREAGSEFVGCGVTYRLNFAEQWGAP